MNKFHRVVWNESAACWVAASELASSHSKGRRRSRLASAASAAGLVALLQVSGVAQAEVTATTVVPASGKTGAYISVNGVPVVDIETANERGLSHNYYNRYDVEANGLVLNNGNNSQISRASELAGQVAANVNLVNEATVILNEVVSTSPSALRGYTEVLGGRADVVIANPNGLTCDGCGFINTDRVTLTTGQSRIGADGSLIGFDVHRGAVTMEGRGADVSDQQIFDIVARSAILRGAINGIATTELGVTTGTNRWSYTDRTVTEQVDGEGEEPSFAVDSSALGGMYAGTIRILATEAGVGVMMLGEAAASADDFVISGEGKVEIRAAISAEGDLAVTTTSATGAGDLVIEGEGVDVTSGGDLNLRSEDGQMVLGSGEIFAGADLNISAGKLQENGGAGSSRYAGGNFSMEMPGHTQLNGSTWGAGKNLSVDFEQVTVGANGATIYAGETLTLTAEDNMALGTAALSAGGDATITTSDGSITVGAGGNQGIQATNGSLNLAAADGFSNAGVISADAGSLTVRTGGQIVNQGDLHAGADLDLGDQNGAGNINITNSGSIIADDSLMARALAFVNQSGASVVSGEDLTLTANSLTQADTDSVIMGATSGSGDANITVASDFENRGVIHSGDNLNLQATAIDNTLTGGISALGELSATATTGDIDNGGAFYAGEALALQASNGTIYNEGTRTKAIGTIDSSGSINLTADEILNQSLIQADGDLTATARVIRNEVAGGDDRTWEYRAYHVDPWVYDTNSWYTFPDDYEVVSYRETWTDYQYYALGKPTFKPQLISGDVATLSGFDSAVNMAAVISGDTVNITGNGGGASFVNNDLSLTRNDFVREYEVYTEYIALGPGYYSRVVQNDSTVYTPSTTDSVVGTGMYATTLNAAGFALSNLGSPFASNPNRPEPGVPTFGGINFTLPSNPNGRFVVSPDPDADFLVESNPLFDVGSDFQGTDYMASRYQYDPEIVTKRLGDAGYEAHLVRQQLVAQIGDPMLGQYSDTADMMQGLMDNALDAAEANGFVYGQAPTEEQLASLDADIVWMVETEVDGQTVLAPVVYLAKATRDAISDGPVIAANTTSLDLTSLENKGGVIAGKESLTILAKNDITNTSGTIKGGNVKVVSTEGSITNKTAFVGSGGDSKYQTVLGKAASIESTGDMTLDAGKDITNIGADISAAGNATLAAGNDITFDTIEDKTTTSYTKAVGEGMAQGVERNTTTTVNQVGSGLNVGGSLDASSGNDITFAGTEVNVGGDASIDAANDLNLVARENTMTSSTKKDVSGLGVGGGVYGMQSTETDEFRSRNFGSEMNIGGNADLSAGETMTVQGSELNVGGDAEINVTDLQVLAGKDVDRKTTKTTTTTFLSVDDQGANDPVEVASANPDADDSDGDGDGEDDGGVGVSASHEAEVGVEAQAEHSASAGVTLASTNVTKTDAFSQRSVGSKLGIGGNMVVNAAKDVVIQGSDVDIAGDAEVNAENIAFLAAQNIETRSSSSETTSIGLYASTDNAAQAGAGASTASQANAGANAQAGDGTASANASAGASTENSAEAGASASSSNTLDLMRIQKDTMEALDITHTGTGFRSGGNMALNATETLLVQGSDVEAEGDVDLKAKDMRFEAVQDISTESRSSSTTTVGLYVDAGGEAGADAHANGEAVVEAGVDANDPLATTGSASASGSVGAEAGAEAKIGAGIQAKNVTTTSESGSSTARVSSIKSGSGSVSRTAEKSIVDVGTSIAAATDFNQSAETIEMLAAQNSQYESTTREETIARIGVYTEASAGAGASAEAEASADTSGEVSGSASASAEAGAEVRAGVEATLDRTVENTTRKATQAVTSNIVVGGNMNSASSGKTVMQGTNIDTGGDINLAASELALLAARDTEEVTESVETIATRLATSVGATAEASASAEASTDGEVATDVSTEVGVGVKAEASAEYDKQQSREASTQAVVGALASGGKLNINTTGATVLEGTQIDAAEGVGIAAESLDFKAAQNTYEQSESALNAAGDLAVSGGLGTVNNGSMNMSMEMSESQASGTEAVTGSINSGAGIDIRTAEDLRLEGTQIAAADDTNLSAGGNVAIDAARNTAQSSGNSMNAAFGFDTAEVSAYGSGGFTDESASSSEAVTSSIDTGGALNISAGNDATFEGANLSAGGDAQVAAGRDVKFNEARNESASESTSFQAEASFGGGGEEDEESGETTTSASGGFSVEGGYEKSKESEAVAGSLTSGGNLTVVAGRDAEFVGTELAAADSALIDAGRDVNFKAAESTSESVSIGGSLGIGSESETTTQTKGEDKGKSETESSVSGEAGLEFGVGSSVDQQGATVSAGGGGVQVNAGRNLGMQGTEIETEGSADLAAGGQVTQTAARSQSVEFGLSMEASAEQDTSPEQDADDAKGADASEADAGSDDAADTADAADAEEEEDDGGPEVGVSGISLAANSSTDETSISAAGGQSVKSGVSQAKAIEGVDMMLRPSQSSDGSYSLMVPVPGNLPAGTSVAATQADGSPLPSWAKFDPSTGELKASPPDDYQGDLKVVVAVPQSNGKTRKVGAEFK